MYQSGPRMTVTARGCACTSGASIRPPAVQRKACSSAKSGRSGGGAPPRHDRVELGDLELIEAAQLGPRLRRAPPLRLEAGGESLGRLGRALWKALDRSRMQAEVVVNRVAVEEEEEGRGVWLPGRQEGK